MVEAGGFQLNGFFAPTQKRHLLAASEKRVSCRKFGGELSAAKWAAISYGAGRCCLEGVRFVLGACDEGFFKGALLQANAITGVTRFAALIADTTELDYMLKAGISGEAFVLLATDNDVATCWVTQSYKKKECPVMVKPEEQVIAIIALGNSVQGALPKKRKAMERILKGASLSHLPDWAQQAALAVQNAPSYQNIQPWELSYKDDSLIFHGIERQKLEIGIAMLHAETAIEAPHCWLLADEKNVVAKVSLI